jgi:thiamine pyrophosphate-dependent acetolactate synthase large subunit-like protein
MARLSPRPPPSAGPVFCGSFAAIARVVPDGARGQSFTIAQIVRGSLADQQQLRALRRSAGGWVGQMDGLWVADLWRMTVAEFIAERLVRLGIRHVFGVGGANIEDLFAAIQRRRPTIRAVLAKHEHSAGAAADGYSRATGGLGVVMTTSGGGAMNLVHALAEARASRTPVLAVVGEPPTEHQGKGAFQDTSGKNGAVDAAQVFRAVATFVGRVEAPDDLPALWDQAVAAALGSRPGPAVLLIAKDWQRAELGPTAERAGPPTHAVPAPPYGHPPVESLSIIKKKDPTTTH